MGENSRADSIYEYILYKIVIPAVGSVTTYQNTLNDYGKLILGDKFSGVYASDKIPKLTPTTPYAILNLDASNMRGSHWVAVAKVNNKIMVYDSFGRKSNDILPSIFKSGNGRIVDTEYDAEQMNKETNCGARSLAWLLLLDNWGYVLAKLI